MECFLTHFCALAQLGLAFFGIGKYVLHLPYKTRKQAWELAGSTFILIKLRNLFLTYPYLFDLSSRFLTCPEPASLNHDILSFCLAWYSYSHNYQELSHDPSYSLSMKCHHIATIALIGAAQLNGFTSEALAILYTTTASNPFLHAMHLTTHPRIKIWAFFIFFIVFTVMRVVVYPIYILRHTLFNTKPFVSTLQHASTYVIINTLLCYLYTLQLRWFNTILRLLPPFRA